MTPNEYLDGVLESQKLSDEIDVLIEHRDEVESFLREEFGDDPVIRYAGSKAKGTMIKESYDLDIVCYFPSDAEKTIKEIHDEVESKLREKYDIETKDSALRIRNIDENKVVSDYHIDVVPGRFIDGESGDAFLHVVYGENERMQTNIDKHIEYISKSKCRKTIKLMKLWNERNNLHIKTFVLEIFIVETLRDFKEKGRHDLTLKKVFESMRDNFENICLKDPANSNNVVSQLITGSHKKLIASRAKSTLALIEKSNDISDWKKIFNEVVEKKTENSPIQIANPSKPWCQCE